MPLFSHDSKADALGRAPLFAELSRGDLHELAKVTEDLEVEEGKVLCREGETAREFFVIVDGEVEVTKDGETVRTLGAGDFFGEIALIEHLPRTATVTARSPLRFFVLTSQSFLALLDRQPGVERQVLRALARRVLATADDPTLETRDS
ncbi:MAG: cyclic nucleotide-binding domain-containing protein [Actinobacteria bacterium]|nr:cyclic nucleotide-binding domain-containing protein [Actinomycetota bacterium]